MHWKLRYHKLSLTTGARDRMVQSVVINFSSKVYSKSLLQKFTKRVTFVVYLSLGSYILSRSMEADILESKKDLYLVQKYGGRYFEKVKRINILSRSMEADMFDKRIGAYGYIL